MFGSLVPGTPVTSRFPLKVLAIVSATYFAEPLFGLDRHDFDRIHALLDWSFVLRPLSFTKRGLNLPYKGQMTNDQGPLCNGDR